MRTAILVLAVVLLFFGIAAADFEVPPYQALNIEAKVPAYQVLPDLSNIANANQFGAFTSRQKELLASNAFFVSQADEQQLYFVYEDNDYKVIPNFIASDAVLQLYHIFYDYSLREMEAERLIPLAEKLTSHMLAQSLSTYKHLLSGPVRNAALKNVAYFGVAARAFAIDADLPPEAAAMVAEEWKRILAHEGRLDSAIFPFCEDYSQYVPRGHYTRNETMHQYFRAMMWYGRMPFPLIWPESPATIDYEQIRQSLLITRALYETALSGKPAIETWERIYEPTSFYVETSDDLTPAEWRQVALRVWGRTPGLSDLADEAKLKEFSDAASQLRPPRIATKERPVAPLNGQPAVDTAGGEEFLICMPTGIQFRFMGQRLVPDSAALQGLVDSAVPGRLLPKGLDVMSALGSERAYQTLDMVYKETRYDKYASQMVKFRAELAAKTDSDWRRNLYWGWVWVFRGLIEPAGPGYPSFMRSDAWLDKELNTALASWAEMRHDTILYVKQSYTAECGDGEAHEQPPVPKGYVEPLAEVYHRLLWLTQATRGGLRQRDLLTPALDEAFGRMEDLLVFLEGVSVKEMRDEPLTAAEYDQIRLLGAELEHLTNLVTQAIGGRQGELVSEADEDIAVIADVHTNLRDGECLEEAVGHANHIFVVVPIQGTLYLTRGSTFSYYEFPHPLSDRLTDEKWQEMLGGGEVEAPPVWTKSFLSDPKAEIPVPKVPRRAGHGC